MENTLSKAGTEYDMGIWKITKHLREEEQEY